MSNDLVIWASQDVVLPVAGTANKIKPDSQLSNIGWDKGQKPSAQEFNFILNQVTSTLERINKYGAPLIGELVFWPLQQMPNEIWPDIDAKFIPYIGQSFSKTTYPLLGMLHPSGVLPADMRGEFPRGWDNGRGIDSGRVLMSAQSSEISDHVHSLVGWTGNSSFLVEKTLVPSQAGIAVTKGDGGNIFTDKDATGTAGPSARFVATRGINGTSGENRSRNIAWNMIVRAA